MTRKTLSAVTALVLLAIGQPFARAYTVEYRDHSGIVARRWLRRPIIVAFSSSLASPPPNIKSGSDVIGAARRALDHWASVASIQFLETRSSVQTINAANAGDGVNLITVSTENAAAFGDSEVPGRTRVFYDSGGAIVEADIALNPAQAFSTDGTFGTYDLESTLTHEVGHLLGLEHSGIIGATMQPRQAKNGVYSLPAITERTLSEDDIAGARVLYGSRAGTGAISGRLIGSNFAGQSQPIFGGHVFAEDILTGRVVAGSVTFASGEFRLGAIAPGNYRLIGQSLDGPVAAAEIASAGGFYSSLAETKPIFRSFIGDGASALGSLSITRETVASLGFIRLSTPPPTLRPRVIGMYGELSTTALPLTPGETVTVYVGGDGLDQILANGISLSSPYFAIDPASLALEEFDTSYPVISFEITVAPNTPPGEYSIRLQSPSGELAYLAGALTVDPEVDPF
ncbi:MAG: matrixin family metalloprotease [Acidobacteriota bacterium]